ncbi:MAG: GDP-mannose 4,6-dehydratase [Chloroflexota bacterium]|nr:GDP-mannose 4,6-dehydratase [Chloroflexota bacterium]
MGNGNKSKHPSHEGKPVLITGGAGFVGTNVASRLLSSGQRVLIYDSLARPGVDRNLRWLTETYGDLVQVEIGDVRDAPLLRHTVQQASRVFHFAAQVAVTTSLLDPVDDFLINACGTLNLLEALRGLSSPPPLVFTSTNKVYGGLGDVPLHKSNVRYEPVDRAIKERGIGEDHPLDFHSPYGCSKGAADQYVLDYARTYGVHAVVFRMSCIYGPHQFGTEDQGWVAHFLIRALKGEPITLYGDGKQVRDILFVEDLVNAFMLAHDNMGTLPGQAFNIGGGPSNTVSLLEILELIGEIHGKKPDGSFEGWRPGDQRYYVSDTTKFSSATGWRPQIDPQQGVEHLYNWLGVSRKELRAKSSNVLEPRASVLSATAYSTAEVLD